MPEESSDHGQMTIIKLQAIDPSPFQRRQHFEENKLKGLAASIQRDGLIEPIVVRPNRKRYQRKNLSAIETIEKIFKNLPKPLEWRSFFNHDLPLLIDFCEEVRDVSIRQRLNRSQTRALAKLRSASIQEFQRVTAHTQMPAPSPVFF